MTKESFYEEMKSALIAQKPEEMEISFATVNKPNLPGLHACTLKMPGVMAAPTFYLEDLQEDYEKGVAPEDIARSVIEFAKENHIDILPGGLDIGDYESVRKNLGLTVIGVKDNKEYLENTVYRRIEDLALIPTIIINDEKGTGKIRINRDFLKEWGVTEKEVMTDAERNAPRLMPPRFQRMSDIFPCPEIKNNPADALYVVTNEYFAGGASALFYPGFLDFMAAAFGTDLLILPSSVNEVIILPDCGADAEELLQMVKTVNRTQLEPGDFLSDAIYHYNHKDGFKKILPAG